MDGHDRFSHEAAERQYDGPLPEPLRAALRAGSARESARVRARAELDFLADSIHAHLVAMRALRATGLPDGPLRRDLAVYRRAWRRWREALARLG
jgi:hypothetical protein